MSFMGLLFILLLAATASAQEPVFRAGVSLVKVDAQVTDRRGRVIRDLAKEDFQLFDENQPQKIEYFGRESEPLDLLLLLDVSGSMHRSLDEMAATARLALKQLYTDDRVAVMLFARNAEVREPFTSDFGAVQEEIRDAVRAKNLGAGTAINESIIKAAQYVSKQPVKGRRAILIVTDNLSLNYKVTDEDVIRELYAADAVLNAILIGKQKRPDPPRPGAYVNPDFTPSDVFKLAERTGGEAVESRKAGESFQQMIERIRARYSLQYPAPAASPGGFRRIRVELSPEARRRHPGAVVRARAGYYAL
jgi:VWFA-related protein